MIPRDSACFHRGVHCLCQDWEGITEDNASRCFQWELRTTRAKFLWNLRPPQRNQWRHIQNNPSNITEKVFFGMFWVGVLKWKKHQRQQSFVYVASLILRILCQGWPWSSWLLTKDDPLLLLDHLVCRRSGRNGLREVNEHRLHPHCCGHLAGNELGGSGLFAFIMFHASLMCVLSTLENRLSFSICSPFFV